MTPPLVSRTNPELMAVARGDRQADLAFINGQVVNVFTRTIETVSVSVFGGRIAALSSNPIQASKTIDLQGQYLAPGLIDAHMHVESTMMIPREFVRMATPHGTTGVVFDPHEIANVLGIAGIRFLMDASAGLPMNIMFAASSCVPSSRFETSGAKLEADDLAPLFDDPRVIALAEMMNFPGVFMGDPDILAKVQLGLDRAIVDGHCPGLTGSNLCAYASSGISSDHESTTSDEALEKIKLGLRVFLREGSAARNLEALIPAITPQNATRFCLCTDDRHPGDLHRQGHIDHVVRKAIALGLDPATALAMGSLHVAEHYRLPDLGAIAPGRQADLMVFDDLTDIRPRTIYWQGQLVAQNGTIVERMLEHASDPNDAPCRDSVTLPQSLSIASFEIKAEPDTKLIRAIQATPHQLITGEIHIEPTIKNGCLVTDPSRDLLKMAVIARHGISDQIGLGFVTGFGFANGALASTVGHDAHNLAVIGTNDEDMLIAARALEKAHGGQCVVKNGQVLCLLPLPIAGLISDAPAQKIIDQQDALLKSVQTIGCLIEDPFMPLSFLPLPVIPRLKLTDMGLIDVQKQCVVPITVR